MPRASWTDEEFIYAVKNATSIAGVLRLLGLVPIGGNYATVNTNVKRLGLDTRHFRGQGWNLRLMVPKPARPLEDILTLNEAKGYNSSSLRKRLIKEGLLEPKCSSCGLL